MKKQWSILFLGICFTVSTFCSCESSYDDYDDAKFYTAGDFQYQATEVKEIEIDWIGGSIEIQPGESGKVSGIENSLTRSDSQKMYHYLDGDTLKIEYCASGYKGEIDENQKNLQIEIPKGIDLHIETKSASVSIGTIEVRSLSIDSTSGDITGERWTVQTDVEIETGSGCLSVGELIADDLDFDSKSGSLSIERCQLKQIDGETKSGTMKLGMAGLCVGSLETTSGKVVLRSLEKGGLGVRFKSFTGELKTERAYGKENRYHFFGERESEHFWQIGVDTVSGDLYVE